MDDDIWNVFDLQKKEEDTECLETCKECGRNNIVTMHDDGCTICKDCGVVNEEVIVDEGAEWRNYADSSVNMDRCSHVDELYPKSSLGTTIQGNDYQTRKFRKMEVRMDMPYQERRLYKTTKVMEEYVEDYGLTKGVVKSAIIYYKRLIDTAVTKYGKAEIHRGDVLKGIIGACLFHACREDNNSDKKTHVEIAAMMKVNINHVRKGCAILEEALFIRKGKNLTYEDFIKKFYDPLRKRGVPFSIVENAITVLQRFQKSSKLGDHIPKSVAAGMLWFALAENSEKYKVKKKDLSIICKVSEVTITKVYKEILQSENN